MSFEAYPIGVGPQFEGERVRKKEMYIELGGPKIEKKFELCEVKPAKAIKDGMVKIIGPDISELKEGGSYPIGAYLEISGSQLEQDLEAVIERRFHDFSNFIQGFMHLNQRYTNWFRLSKKSYEKGLNSFNILGEILIKLFKAEYNIIEKAQITFITDKKQVDAKFKYAMEVYDKRDERIRGMKDEDVEEFYACTLCASFAPKHACAIAPNRMSLCGAINWFDARAAAKVDPKGPIFRIEKGECLNEKAGEYTGINEMIKNASLGEIDKIYMYSGLEYPHTSCGCFEAIAFYIPEVEGYGVVDRDFKGIAVNGLPFSTMANSTGGGNQVEGFNGISIEYMRSPRFFQYDDGWNRFVWLPSSVKERINEFIPKDLLDKIATEAEVTEINELKDFLQKKEHPVMKRWEQEEEEADEEEGIEEYPQAQAIGSPTQIPYTMPTQAYTPQGIPPGSQSFILPGIVIPAPSTGSGPGFKIIFKNVKIHAESVTVKKIKPKKKK
ncbi:MAG: CO dehydrogenase/CO-methylating acetyl-CoA synthase complex subunit beta [Candidatus Lokiarchaeota archaeon]|nr:CO dehydrogenase/CO-methylating acetyl-CoA synthase complex subunit beta [Candidatus Lokiarchaeota archaeon]